MCPVCVLQVIISVIDINDLDINAISQSLTSHNIIKLSHNILCPDYNKNNIFEDHTIIDFVAN